MGRLMRDVKVKISTYYLLRKNIQFEKAKRAVNSSYIILGHSHYFMADHRQDIPVVQFRLYRNRGRSRDRALRIITTKKETFGQALCPTACWHLYVAFSGDH